METLTNSKAITTNGISPNTLSASIIHHELLRLSDQQQSDHHIQPKSKFYKTLLISHQEIASSITITKSLSY